MHAGGALDLHDVVDAPLGQAGAEGAVVPVTGVGTDHRRRGQPPTGEFVEHLQRQFPLGPVPHRVRDGGLRPSCRGVFGVLVGLGAHIVPGLGQKQPPAQRARRGIGRRVHAHPDLAVGDLAQRPGVLTGHPRGGRPVLGETGVIDHPRLRLDQPDRLGRQAPADRLHGPGRGRHELLQLLVVDPEPLAHRLHRLAPALQHQTPQVQPALGPLVLPGQRGEHLGHERLQLTPHPLNLVLTHAARLTGPDTD